MKIIVQWRSLEFFGRWLKVSKNVDHGWPTKKVLGYGTAKAVNLGLFSMIFRVLYHIIFSRRTILPTLTLD